ncbi:hypothetical protein GCK72_010358 [Caenorhabditis remanei]|uniref:Mediator of RNA polymerase II transcription subunit 29 n=1 Tax=Caenorhabditis remanei TaxID=31234 RepID=A0A6A5H5G7_CAERE|nr:hypothetical protein GCK72_010358 [Caenorhabditis remanei]KAF1762096.1 hypothetical protein GCK72_010358 [Caenorhabditis remanei]
MSGQGQQPNLTAQQQQMILQQQQQHMMRQQHMQQQQMHQRQMQQQVQPTGQFQRARTPQMQQHAPGGSPGGSHLQMHPHLQPPGHMQPRSPLVGSQLNAPGSVPAGNPATPQMMHQQMGMNQPMSLPAHHISRPASVAPPASVPPNLQTTGGGPPSNQMDSMGGQPQYPLHLQPQQTPSRPGSQQGQHVNNSHGGPQSVQQPTSIQRPGSVLAPGSIQQPESLGAPPSNSVIGGPQSVQGYGPGSVQPPGSAQAPSSAQPGSAFAPGSIQAPASQQPPSSIQPPPSAASSSAVGGATAAQNSKEPLKPNEEQIRMVQDPVDLVRNLVQKDLRNSVVEMNKRGADLVRQREEKNVNESDRAQFKRAANDFHAVCDEIDRTLTTVMETAKQLIKLEKVFMDRNSKELDGELMVNSVQSFVDNTDIVQKMFDETIGGVTASMEKMRRRQKKWEDLQKETQNNEDVEMIE